MKNKKTNFIKLGILLFGISLFFFNCEAEDYVVDKENLQFNTTSQKEAQLLFDKHSKKQYKSKNNNVLKIEIDWKDFKQDDLSFTEALLSNVSAKLNVDITYKSRLIFININNKTIKAIETQNIESFDSNGNIQNGIVYYHKFNGTFLIGYQVINGKTEKRLLPKKDINTANFFSFFTLNEDCNEQLNPNNTFCDQELEGFTITATKSTPPKSSPLYYYILDQPTLEEDSYEDGTKVGGGGSGGGDDNNDDDDECPEDKKCPCFGTTSNIDTSNAFSSNTIINSIQSVLDAYGIKGDALDFLKQKEIFSPGTLTKTANDYIKGNKALGSAAGVLGIGISIAEYLEEPSTANLLRVAVDGAATTLPLAGSLSLTAIEILYENENGETIIDIILRAAAEAIEEAMDCDLGAGIHGLIF
jgi:hypothetical protein